MPTTDATAKFGTAGYVNGIPANWKPTPARPVPSVQCTGKRKDGNRCEGPSILGATVCRRHGGQLPVVKKRAEEVVAAARLRLLNDTDMAIDVFERLMQPGSGEAVALKAAELVLNYNGLKQPDQVDVTVTTGDDPAQLVRERLERLALGAASKSSSSELEEDDIVDAEVVPEQDTLF